tara:strand:- start:1349 stop:1828 length:480 start_codon:yes stop_codon:yes gene_type:complete
MVFTALVKQAVSTAASQAVSTVTSLAAQKVGSAIFGSQSTPGRSVGSAGVATGQKTENILTNDSDLDAFQRGISASGFVRGIADYRSVGAQNVSSQTRGLADSGLQQIIQSMMSSPPITPDVASTLTGLSGSTGIKRPNVSLRGKKQKKRFDRYIKGLT